MKIKGASIHLDLNYIDLGTMQCSVSSSFSFTPKSSCHDQQTKIRSIHVMRQNPGVSLCLCNWILAAKNGNKHVRAEGVISWRVSKVCQCVHHVSLTVSNALLKPAFLSLAKENSAIIIFTVLFCTLRLFAVTAYK